MECVGTSIKIMVEIVAFSAECISGIPNNLIKNTENTHTPNL